ncbi:MAG TPA: carboxypeptidase regulatory-like domain-containing protein [Bryobacteraceae bacterium]|nr:carboxypeptidase regulatory-like domain-containing protein [Bryobacteraceae bacterium]
MGAGRLAAQASNATIHGTVTDTTGAAIAGATVTVKNTATGVTNTVTTNNQGIYNVPDLLVGTYEVNASKQGFQNVVRSGITLLVGAQAVVDMQLPVGQAQQTVTIQGEVSQVNTESAAVSSNVDQVQMRDLPLNGRNFNQLISLSPGVTQTYTGSAFYGQGENFSVAGGRPEGQAYLLDDTDVQGFWNHGTGAQSVGSALGVEAIAEFQVLTNTYSAQFGGDGGAVNAVTKSGTNSFHGSAYDFLRNSALDARGFFDARKPGFRRNQYGGSLGGPVKKDKLFFFVNYEGLANSLGETGRALVPDQAIRSQYAASLSPLTAPILNLYPLPNGGEEAPGVGIYNSIANLVQHENFVLARVDWTPSANDSIFFQYHADYANQTVPFSGGGGQLSLWPEIDNDRNQYFTSEERHVFSPDVFNVARFGYVRPVQTAHVNGETPPLNFFPGTGREDGEVAITGYTTLGANTLIPYYLVQNKFWYGDTLLWTKGSHTVKFGVDVGRIQSNIYAPFIIGGEYSFASFASFAAATPSLFLGVAPDQGDATRDFREIDVFPFIQDDWKVTRTLTLNLGFRWDYTTDPVGVRHPLNTIVEPPSVAPPGSTGFQTVTHVLAHNVNARNFDPRFGFAWDPFSDHKTSIRGGFGIFHDPIAPREYASDYYLAPPFSFQAQLPIGHPIPFPNPYPNYIPGSSKATGAVSILEGVDYQNTSAPYNMQWNFNVQREVAPSTVLTAGYVGSKGVHLTMQIDQNPVIPQIGPNGQQIFGVFNGSVTAPSITPLPRLNPAFSYVNNGLFAGYSIYNALQVNLTHRLAANFTAQVSYTWSRCIDDDSGSYGLEGAANVMNPYNAALDRGPCNYNIPQNLVVNGVYQLPFKGNRLKEGWELAPILSARNGLPFTVTDGFDQAGDQNSTPRPNVVPNCAAMVRTVSQWYNPNCFALEPAGTYGNLGRNTFVGPGFLNLDFGIYKNTKINERINTQFRAEFFDILNRANFGLPTSANFADVAAMVNGHAQQVQTLNPIAGAINSLAIPASSAFGAPYREIQFALKVIF